MSSASQILGIVCGSLPHSHMPATYACP